MIFPELPRRTEFYSRTIVKTPLHKIEPVVSQPKIDVDEWFRTHGLATDPAAVPYIPRSNEPINWWARDALELYALITVYAVWLAYWLGVHREWW